MNKYYYREFESIFQHQNSNIINKSIVQKNAILGIIQGYTLNRILPFFKSIIQSNITNCDIIMFTRNISLIAITYLKSINVIIYEIPKKYKNISVINVRWKMYADYLKENKNKYKLIFHADVRDTIFQKNIFDFYQNNESFLGVAIEDGTLDEKLNKHWLINFVGIEKHKKIKKERIICVGSIWGTIDKFLEFSIIFSKKLSENPFIEQAIANYMFYYENFLKDYLIKSDNYGPVMTIGLTKREKIVLDTQNNICNFRGEIAAVIHQYDRKPDITKKVINKYCPELLYFCKILQCNNNFNINIYLNKISSIEKRYRNIMKLLLLLLILFPFLLLKIYFSFHKMMN